MPDRGNSANRAFAGTTLCRFAMVAAIAWPGLCGCDSVDPDLLPPPSQGSTVENPPTDDGESVPPPGTNNKPTLSFVIGPAICCNPLARRFEAQVDNFTSHGVITFSWDFGDGRIGKGEALGHVYGLPGTYTVTLEAKLPDDTVLRSEQTLVLPSDEPLPDDDSTPDRLDDEDDQVGNEPDESDDADSIIDDQSEQFEEYINQVLDGVLTTANAAWWGFDEEDSTHAVQSAINSGARRVVIPYVGMDWNVGPIFLVSNQELVLEPGVVLAARRGLFRGINDCLLRGNRVTNVLIRGYGATLRMHKEDYTSGNYSRSEFRHALGLYTASQVTVLGLSLENSGGDGIYVGPDETNLNASSDDLIIRDCVMRENYRQGMSVISARRMRIENCEFRNTRGTSPQAGLDLEPGGPRQVLSDIDVINCRSEDNEGSAYVVNVNRLDAQSTPVGIRFWNCLGRGSKHPGIRVMVNEERVPDGLIEFISCTIERTEYAGFYTTWNPGGNLNVKFDDCRWNGVATLRPQFPIDIKMNGLLTMPGGGKIVFTNSSVVDALARPGVVIRDADPWSALGLVGDLKIFNEVWNPDSADMILEKTELRLRYSQEVPE